MSEYRDAKTYAVAWNDFSGELHLEQVKALHEYHALQESNCDIFEPMEYHTIVHLEDLYDAAFERGCDFLVMEIKPE